jgi:hypothetical protein
MSSEIVLPEITIEGSAESQSITAADWWADGFVAGYNAPDAQIERPLMINDELAASFLMGAANGQQAARDAQAELEERFRNQPTGADGNPTIGPEIVGTESLEKVQERFREEFGNLFGLHGHMPHTEIENETLEPLPTPNIVLVD